MSSDIFVYPTDTVWGIGASVYDEKACNKIAELKGVSPFKPVSVVFSSLEQVKEHVEFPDYFEDEWLVKFFSLETTLLVSKDNMKSTFGSWVTGTSDFIGIRLLELPSICSIIESVQSPITSTSLNVTGQSPLTHIDDVKKLVETFSLPMDKALFEDDISPLSGNSSTIVKITSSSDFEVIREGLNIQKVKEHCALLTT